MSHVLSTSNHLESKCTLTIPFKQVVLPKYSSILNQPDHPLKIRKSIPNVESSIMKKLCQKLTQIELGKIRLQNEMNLTSKYQKMKRNMIDHALQKKQQSEVIKYFEGKNQQQSLSSLLRSYTQSVELGIKYKTKITNKLLSIKEASEISSQKQKYRIWLNNENNSPLKNPNFNKMNYVIEKVQSRKQLADTLNLTCKIPKIDGEKSKKLENFRTHKIMRSSDQIGLISPLLALREQLGDYSPKSKVKSLRRKYQNI